MRILVLAPQWPDPPVQGAAIRNLHILLYLAERHRVTLLTFLPEVSINQAQIASVCEHVETLPVPTRSIPRRLKALATSSLPDMAWRLYSDQMRQRVVQLCRGSYFDAIHVEGIEMAPYGLEAKESSKQAHGKQPKLVYDAHNAEYLLQRRAFTTDLGQPRRLPKALYSLIQWWRLRSFEREVCLQSSYVLAVSARDRAALLKLSHYMADRVCLLPNGVDPHRWSRQARFAAGSVPVHNEMLVFDGTMDFRPNVDAVLWFGKEVWPQIRAARPGAQMSIVGRNPTREVLGLGNLPGVTVTGAVEDTRPWVAASTVYVVPMRMGGGVRLKVLQAMAMGCAIVSTPMGVEGINVRDGQEVVLARSASDFAQATVSLLQDESRRASLGRAARELASTQYAWQALLPALDEIYWV